MVLCANRIHMSPLVTTACPMDLGLTSGLLLALPGADRAHGVVAAQTLVTSLRPV